AVARGQRPARMDERLEELFTGEPVADPAQVRPDIRAALVEGVAARALRRLVAQGDLLTAQPVAADERVRVEGDRIFARAGRAKLLRARYERRGPRRVDRLEQLELDLRGEVARREAVEQGSEGGGRLGCAQRP